MALVTLFANSTFQQVLVSGDDFVLGAGVTLGVNNIAIFGTGATESSVFGNVFSTGDSAFLVANGSTTELTIGADANMLSAGQHAVEIQSANSIDLHNAGTLDSIGNSAVFLTGLGVDDAVTIDVLNSGTITAGLTGVTATASEAQIVFNNSGTIQGKSSGAVLNGDNSTTYFNNSGTIAGTTGDGLRFLGTSTVEAVNSGTISTVGNAAVSFSGGTFVNSGTLASGDGVGFTARFEVVLRNTGTILGNVELGIGNDSFTGLNGTVEGAVFGGDGDDVIIGSREDDTLLGEADSDNLYGRGSDDTLFGGDDDDWLFGNRGDDTLVGGGGLDTLRGGVGEDVFLFEGGDSGLRAGADVIAGFKRRVDKIDLSQLDLDFIDKGRFAGAGDAEVRLRVLTRKGDVQIQIDEDGDGAVDMHILVEDTARLSVGDFIL